MAHYPSKRRVERDGVLVYPEGFPIPEDDVDELRAQGYLSEKAKEPTANKARRKTSDK